MTHPPVSARPPKEKGFPAELAVLAERSFLAIPWSAFSSPQTELSSLLPFSLFCCAFSSFLPFALFTTALLFSSLLLSPFSSLLSPLLLAFLHSPSCRQLRRPRKGPETPDGQTLDCQAPGRARATAEKLPGPPRVPRSRFGGVVPARGRPRRPLLRRPRKLWRPGSPAGRNGSTRRGLETGKRPGNFCGSSGSLARALLGCLGSGGHSCSCSVWVRFRVSPLSSGIP